MSPRGRIVIEVVSEPAPAMRRRLAMLGPAMLIAAAFIAYVATL